MKKIFLNTMAVLAAATLFTSCWDTMDDKADIDAAYENASQLTSPGVTLTSATVKSYKRIDLAGSIANLDDVLEMGFLVGENPSMSGAQSFDATEYSTVYSIISPAERGWYEEVVTEVEITEEEAQNMDEAEEYEDDLGNVHYYYNEYSYVLSEDTEIGNKAYFYDAGNTPVSPAKEGWYVVEGNTYQLSNDKTMLEDGEYYAKSLPSSFAAAANGLEGGTTYYVCAYARTAAGLALSEVQELATPETPVYDISGYYFTTEFELDQDASDVTWIQEDGMYAMYIEQEDPSDPTSFIVYNLWGFNGETEAVYDPDEQILSIPSGSNIGSHPTYGALTARGVNASISAYTSSIDFEFTPKGGYLNSSPFQVTVSAGSFGFYRVEMEHMSDDDVAEIFGSAKPRKYAPFTRFARKNPTLK